MKKTKSLRIAGLAVLALLWFWLAWGVLASGPITLIKLIVLAMSAIIIFVPLYRKYISEDNRKKE